MEVEELQIHRFPCFSSAHIGDEGNIGMTGAWDFLSLGVWKNADAGHQKWRAE